MWGPKGAKWLHSIGEEMRKDYCQDSIPEFMGEGSLNQNKERNQDLKTRFDLSKVIFPFFLRALHMMNCEVLERHKED